MDATCPFLIGHRGARAHWPENTVEGFSAALQAGISWFEIDVGMTRDGVVVLGHDHRLAADLTRSRDGAWLAAPGRLVRAMDLHELQSFDVGRLKPGSATARCFPNQSAIDGARIPTLDRALQLHPAARWTIEIKTYANRPRRTAAPEAIAEAVADCIDRAAAAARVVVQSFDWRGPRHLRRARPDLGYAWLTSRATRAWRGGQARLPDTILAEGGGTWSPHYRELTPRTLDRAKRAGLLVVPWTVNRAADIRRLTAWGVDGLITDDPVMARASLHGGVPEPRPGPGPS